MSRLAGLFSPDDWSHDAVLDTTLKVLVNAWNTDEHLWLLGGSSSLKLQGVELAQPPNDIDVYADFHVAKILHKLAPGVPTDEQVLDRSGTYTSLLSHYRVEQAAVELSGGFEICTNGSLYRTETELLCSIGVRHPIKNTEFHVSLTPLSHELLFNVLRDRKDRYAPIAAKISEDKEQHLPLIRLLIRRNVWSDPHLRQIEQLLNIKL
ncbi:hypothetical protein M3231_13675 [Neobacillus mesonae]|nr:hypothetical protein [Neobacillus mesonae]